MFAKSHHKTRRPTNEKKLLIYAGTIITSDNQWKSISTTTTIIIIIITTKRAVSATVKMIYWAIYRFLGHFPAIVIVSVSADLFQDELSAVFPLHAVSWRVCWRQTECQWSAKSGHYIAAAARLTSACQLLLLMLMMMSWKTDSL